MRRVVLQAVVLLPWILIGLIVLALPSCSAPPAPPVMTKVVVERVTIPAGLLSCAPEPQIGTITLQSQVADYIVRLEEAGADCRDTVSSIAKIEATPAPAAP
jgi:hypothetical protein